MMFRKKGGDCVLTLLIGTDWVSNRNRLLQMIAQDVADEKQGRILIVPELISHDTERRLSMIAGDTLSRFAEVLSFTRLAKTVSDEVGHAAAECLDNGGRVVAMASAVRQLHSKLKAYASVETKPEFLTGLVDAVDEFKRCCIQSADLNYAAQQTSGSFAQKLEELALILSAYDAVCAQGKCDPRDQMTRLLEELETSTFARERVFYIDGFPDLTRQHMAIVNHLIRESGHVVISLNCDHIYSESLAFTKAGQTAGEILNYAKQEGIASEVIVVEPEEALLQPVREGLFQGKIENASKDILQLTKADSVYHECLTAAEQIMRLVHNGARYRDISIVYSDPGTYGNTLEMVLSRCHIPVYISGTEPVVGKSVVATVIAAMDAAFGGFETADVLRYVKSALSPVSLNTCDKLENYVRLWGIDGKRWLTDWEANPAGLTDKWTDALYASLNELNEARKQIIDPLVTLRNAFRAAPNLAQQIQALYAFFKAIQLDSRLDRLARKLDDSGENRSAQILDQLWDILIGALEQLHDVLGTTVWDEEMFVRLFKLLIGQYDVGTIPPVLDAVTAGPVSAMRCQEPQHLFVLGASEGNLPGYAGSSGVLTDQERTQLRTMGIPLTGGAMEGLEAEFAEIYGVFCGARRTVHVSCAGAQPSFVYRRLLSMCGYENVSAPYLGTALGDPMEAGAFFARTGDIDSARAAGVEEAYETVRGRVSYEFGSISPENIHGLYGEKLNLSASQVDKLADCRCHYFLRYGLRVNELKPATVDPAEFGTYVHAVLENTAREICEMGGFSKVTEEQTLEIARQHSQNYARERFAQISADRSNYLFNRNRQELELIVKELWEELHNIAFEPVGFEVSFGDECMMPPIDCSGSELQAQLRGFVDRVDRWDDGTNTYFRVVDYKTGRKDFDYCDVFNGLGLQMLLYLFALEQEGEDFFCGKAVPAGVQYFPARVPLVSAEGNLTDEELTAVRAKNWKRKGLLLLDSAVLTAMESPETPGRLPYTVRKDGTYVGDLADKKQLQMLLKYIFKLLKKMVDNIASGEVKPNPYTRGASHNACAFCPYGAICHKYYVEDRRNYQAMTAQRFWEEVEKEVTGNV